MVMIWSIKDLYSSLILFCLRSLRCDLSFLNLPSLFLKGNLSSLHHSQNHTLRLERESETKCAQQFLHLHINIDLIVVFWHLETDIVFFSLHRCKIVRRDPIIAFEQSDCRISLWDNKMNSSRYTGDGLLDIQPF